MSYNAQNIYSAISNLAYQPEPSAPAPQSFSPAYEEPYNGFVSVYEQPTYNQNQLAYFNSLSQDYCNNQVRTSATLPPPPPPQPPVEASNSNNNISQQQPETTIIFLRQDCCCFSF